MSFSCADSRQMTHALELAVQGEGAVEPNPMVGCVIVRDDKVVGAGWHRQFGGPHAEVDALAKAGAASEGATMYVSLEPCCHQGKTPPCTRAIIDAKICRVVLAMRDPFPQVDGGGMEQLQAAGIVVETGLLEDESKQLNAPYLKRLDTGLPWVIAKWAMTLDGKIATRNGDSQWISNEKSRKIVHQLRGRVDAIIVGRGTAKADDPLLTARPPGPRVATRVVLDSQASLSLDSQLVKTASQAPVLIAVSAQAPEENRQRLEASGCEVLLLSGNSHENRLQQLLAELGSRQMTNLLVEGGGHLFGGLFDLQAIDEVHTFIASKLIGGDCAPTPIGGKGVSDMGQAWELGCPVSENLAGDIYLHGRLQRKATGE